MKRSRLFLGLGAAVVMLLCIHGCLSAGQFILDTMVLHEVTVQDGTWRGPRRFAINAHLWNWTRDSNWYATVVFQEDSGSPTYGYGRTFQVKFREPYDRDTHLEGLTTLLKAERL